MKRETFSVSTKPMPPGASPLRDVCRALFALDQIIEPKLRDVGLARSDFDMLLDLYIAGHDARPRCMWDVCQTVSVPFSTAHRRLTAMITRGFVVRAAPCGDWRRVIVALSPGARLLIEAIAGPLKCQSGSDAVPAPAAMGI